MKVLYDYTPASSADTSVAITESSQDTIFLSSNLKTIKPVQSWKSQVITESWIMYDFGSAKSLTGLFLNRFNFAAFTIQGHTSDTWTDPDYEAVITGLTKDEVYEENYMHYFKELVAFNYRYLRILIPAQTPLFEPTYFKIGNLLVGNFVEIWNPKAGYQIEIVPKENIIEFDSGYSESSKVGRTRRTFALNLDKIAKAEYDKLRLTRSPIVMYNDWESDPNKCYLVKAVGNISRSYEFAQITSHSLSFVEVV